MKQLNILAIVTLILVASTAFFSCQTYDMTLPKNGGTDTIEVPQKGYFNKFEHILSFDTTGNKITVIETIKTECFEDGQSVQGSKRELTLKGSATFSLNKDIVFVNSYADIVVPEKVSTASKTEGSVTTFTSTHNYGVFEGTNIHSAEEGTIELCKGDSTFFSGLTGSQALGLRPIKQLSDTTKDGKIYVQMLTAVKCLNTHTYSNDYNVNLEDTILVCIFKDNFNEDDFIYDWRFNGYNIACDTKAISFDVTLILDENGLKTKNQTYTSAQGKWGAKLGNFQETTSKSLTMPSFNYKANGAATDNGSLTEGNFSLKFKKQAFTMENGLTSADGEMEYTFYTLTINNIAKPVLEITPTFAQTSLNVNKTAYSETNSIAKHEVKAAFEFLYSNCSSTFDREFTHNFEKEQIEDKVEYKAENHRLTSFGDGTYQVAYDWVKYVNSKEDSRNTRTNNGTWSVVIPVLNPVTVTDWTVTNSTATGSWNGYTQVYTTKTNRANFPFQITVSNPGSRTEDNGTVVNFKSLKDYLNVADRGTNSNSLEVISTTSKLLKSTINVSADGMTFDKNFTAECVLNMKEEEQPENPFSGASAGSIIFDRMHNQHDALVVADLNGRAIAFIDANMQAGVRNIDTEGVPGLSANNYNINGEFVISSITGDTQWIRHYSCEVGTAYRKGDLTGEASRGLYETQGYHGTSKLYHVPAFTKNADGTWKATWTAPAPGGKTRTVVVNNIPDPANW